uniref:Lipocalin/cytosolic fatty-acid binding domain-containing protein n=1 Tax=Timema tahoe TaxID=61484 RepID=A0A7R9ILA2_9NEOP|nr:unnamed protein product [Timema tahoe]
MSLSFPRRPPVLPTSRMMMSGKGMPMRTLLMSVAYNEEEGDRLDYAMDRETPYIKSIKNARAPYSIAIYDYCFCRHPHGSSLPLRENVELIAIVDGLATLDTILQFLVPMSLSWVKSFKNCPTKPVQANFNFTRFQGLWYELRRQPNAFEPDSVCVTGDVAVTPQGGLTIVNRWYNTVASQHTLLNGVLRRANNDSQDGRLIVKFTNTNTDVEYSVLGTDYDNYLVVWSCWASSVVNGVPQYTGYSWVLGRSKVLSQEALDAVSSIETSHNIDRTLYEDTRQDNCPVNSSS